MAKNWVKPFEFCNKQRLLDFFIEAGSRTEKMSFTDEEVEQQIWVIRAVLNYLEGRKDYGLAVKALRQDLQTFEDFKSLRIEDARRKTS